MVNDTAQWRKFLQPVVTGLVALMAAVVGYLQYLQRGYDCATARNHIAKEAIAEEAGIPIFVDTRVACKHLIRTFRE